MSIVEQKLEELRIFQEKWGEDLLAQLGIKPGSGLSVSFDSSIQLQSMPQAEPLRLGIYVCNFYPDVQVEVVGQDVKTGVVILDTTEPTDTTRRIEVMSCRLFTWLFDYRHPSVLVSAKG